MQKLEGAASRKVVQVVKLGPQNLGNLVTSHFKSKFSAVDAKQAFLDTLLKE